MVEGEEDMKSKFWVFLHHKAFCAKVAKYTSIRECHLENKENLPEHGE